MMIYLESLGCARNQVDSEIMLGRLKDAGHTIVADPARASAIIVNTCSFIASAADEAVEVILEMADHKKSGACQRLIVTGCLSQRYKNDEDLVSSLPEVDVFLGTSACNEIVTVLNPDLDLPYIRFEDPNLRPFQDLDTPRELLTQYYAYVKVSEGCNRHCTYCIIPELRGRQRSRPVEEICQDARQLVDKGVREIILTAENTTDWGQDSEDEAGFEAVLEALAGTVPESVWIRVLYTHPSSLSEPIIETIARHDHICSYYDVPIQHAADPVLKRMGRPYGRQDLTALFETIRKKDPDAVLRTTLITGFPGETEEDFNTLFEFVKTTGFDHLGVFTYSDAEDLPSHNLKDPVPEEVAQKRHDMLMSLQAGISEEINISHVGQTVEVLVEENPEEGLYLGRTRFQAPDVDGVTFIYDSGLEIGTRVRVKITDGFEYDISGELA
ncbi:MAG: 30S ribosomal protein S12 methylthiotransferase RimO [Desulfobacteraceae bacterium]|nr:MAG: 30S ribosomal protein S12 methylthiotransferase RimO [Desulfobacteraceae bacterium]